MFLKILQAAGMIFFFLSKSQIDPENKFKKMGNHEES
jgi:hypothetical protein